MYMHTYNAVITHAFCRLCMHNYTYGLQDKNAHTLMSEVSSAVNASQGKTVLVIDSLSSLLLFLPLALCHAPPAPIVCRWLLSMHPHHILALLHSDLHEEGVVLQLNSIAVSSMKVIPANPTTSQFTGIVNTIHKRLSGKVLKQVYHLKSDHAIFEIKMFIDGKLFSCCKLYLYGNHHCSII